MLYIFQRRSIQQGWAVRKSQGWAVRELGEGSCPSPPPCLPQTTPLQRSHQHFYQQEYKIACNVTDFSTWCVILFSNFMKMEIMEFHSGKTGVGSSKFSTFITTRLRKRLEFILCDILFSNEKKNCFQSRHNSIYAVTTDWDWLLTWSVSDRACTCIAWLWNFWLMRFTTILEPNFIVNRFFF